MNQVLEEIKKIGIVPVVVLEDAKDAKPLAAALCEGGLPCAEVTFRTEAAQESIRIMTEKFPQMLVGAGTVLTIRQVNSALEAGARFVVSPGLNPKIVEYCAEKGVPILPGTTNPSDIELALELGLEAVKFFPAEAAGGLAMIKAMAAPYANMQFMPTGGIHAGNITEYLAFPKILACGGSWMVSGDLIRAGAFDSIIKLTGEAVKNMLGFTLKHVGLNCGDAAKAGQTAAAFAEIFGLEAKEGNSSVFAGTMLEAMKMPYLGEKGHIAVGTNHVERAKRYLESKGIGFREETAKYRDETLQTIYMKEEIGGFAIHLVRN